MLPYFANAVYFWNKSIILFQKNINNYAEPVVCVECCNKVRERCVYKCVCVTCSQTQVQDEKLAEELNEWKMRAQLLQKKLVSCQASPVGQ